jgi:hypothetical protein
VGVDDQFLTRHRQELLSGSHPSHVEADGVPGCRGRNAG